MNYSTHYPSNWFVKRTVAPSNLLTLAQAKEHLRVSHSEEDDYITALCSVVTGHLDGWSSYTGQAIGQQTYTLTGTRLHGSCEVLLPVNPFSSLTSFSYFDGDNSAQTLNVSTQLRTVSNDSRAVMSPAIGTNWPGMYDRSDAWVLTYVAGFSTVPTEVIHASKLLLGHLYENREATTENSLTEIPYGVSMLLEPFKNGFMS